MINNHGHMVEVDKTVFNIPAAVVHVPTTAAILAVITADPSIAEMMPYVAGDAVVEVVKAQKSVPSPTP